MSIIHGKATLARCTASKMGIGIRLVNDSFLKRKELYLFKVTCQRRIQFIEIHSEVPAVISIP